MIEHSTARRLVAAARKRDVPVREMVEPGGWVIGDDLYVFSLGGHRHTTVFRETGHAGLKRITAKEAFAWISAR